MTFYENKKFLLSPAEDIEVHKAYASCNAPKRLLQLSKPSETPSVSHFLGAYKKVEGNTDNPITVSAGNQSTAYLKMLGEFKKQDKGRTILITSESSNDLVASHLAVHTACVIQETLQTHSLKDKDTYKRHYTKINCVYPTRMSFNDYSNYTADRSVQNFAHPLRDTGVLVLLGLTPNTARSALSFASTMNNLWNIQTTITVVAGLDPVRASKELLFSSYDYSFNVA